MLEVTTPPAPPSEPPITYADVTKARDLLGYKTFNGIGGANQEPGSYRESYSGKGRPRDPRLPLT